MHAYNHSLAADWALVVTYTYTYFRIIAQEWGLRFGVCVSESRAKKNIATARQPTQDLKI